MRSTRVLFLCTGNSCRSQMAEGLLRTLGGDRFEVASAGTQPADRVHPLAVETMRDRGIDISHHRPKTLATFEGQQFDLLVTTCDEANEACPFYPGARRRLHWSVPDPARATGTDSQVRAAFGRTADLLEERIPALLSQS
jgi:arsenate reductase